MSMPWYATNGASDGAAPARPAQAITAPQAGPRTSDSRATALRVRTTKVGRARCSTSSHGYAMAHAPPTTATTAPPTRGTAGDDRRGSTRQGQHRASGVAPASRCGCGFFDTPSASRVERHRSGPHAPARNIAATNAPKRPDS
jgi:hypothetical protein